jgi:hypothetical protein
MFQSGCEKHEFSRLVEGIVASVSKTQPCRIEQRRAAKDQLFDRSH